LYVLIFETQSVHGFEVNARDSGQLKFHKRIYVKNRVSKPVR